MTRETIEATGPSIPFRHTLLPTCGQGMMSNGCSDHGRQACQQQTTGYQKTNGDTEGATETLQEQLKEQMRGCTTLKIFKVASKAYFAAVNEPG